MQPYGARHNVSPDRSGVRGVLRLIKREAAMAKKTKGQIKYLKQPEWAEERVL